MNPNEVLRARLKRNKELARKILQALSFPGIYEREDLIKMLNEIINGKYFGGCEDDFDLFFADDDASKHEGWSNMRVDGNPYIWKTKEIAEKELAKKIKAGREGKWVIVKLEWEE